MNRNKLAAMSATLGLATSGAPEMAVAAATQPEIGTALSLVCKKPTPVTEGTKAVCYENVNEHRTKRITTVIRWVHGQGHPENADKVSRVTTDTYKRGKIVSTKVGQVKLLDRRIGTPVVSPDVPPADDAAPASPDMPAGTDTPDGKSYICYDIPTENSGPCTEAEFNAMNECMSRPPQGSVSYLWTFVNGDPNNGRCVTMDVGTPPRDPSMA